MKTLLIMAALAVACKAPKPVPAPSKEANAVVKYVGGLQADVALAEEARDKANAAIKKAAAAGKIEE